MNNTFDLKRFFLLFRKHSLDYAKTYFLLFTGITIILLVSLGVITSSNHGLLAANKQFNTFFYIMLLCGPMLTSLSFYGLNNKSTGIAELTLPASNFEKFMISWLYSFFLFQLFFIISFYLAGYFVVFYTFESSEKNANSLLNIFSTDQKILNNFILFAFLHALYLWGAIFFKSFHFVKTTMVFIGFLLLITLANKFILIMIIDQKLTGNLPFEGLRFLYANNNRHIYADDRTIGYGRFVFYLIIILLWISAFFTLKEKEI